MFYAWQLLGLLLWTIWLLNNRGEYAQLKLDEWISSCVNGLDSGKNLWTVWFFLVRTAVWPPVLFVWIVIPYIGMGLVLNMHSYAYIWLNSNLRMCDTNFHIRSAFVDCTLLIVLLVDNLVMMSQVNFFCQLQILILMCWNAA